ncbi:hypothetical protein CDAR_479741 [Caerostris darwini]|uniref:Uncharacterized protein n=1 Tax=Caerostris darwini TaxID=1538125 RepID=A0AAV4SSG2_9ARAC|nr:hypothetical protein CDAR_479741 [Caerostris darwini]
MKFYDVTDRRTEGRRHRLTCPSSTSSFAASKPVITRSQIRGEFCGRMQNSTGPLKRIDCFATAPNQIITPVLEGKLVEKAAALFKERRNLRSFSIAEFKYILRY